MRRSLRGSESVYLQGHTTRCVSPSSLMYRNLSYWIGLSTGDEGFTPWTVGSVGNVTSSC